MRNILIAGGSGVLGSHLCKAFLDKGDTVVCIDNLSTGRKKNIDSLLGSPNFIFVQHDIAQPLPQSIMSKKYAVVANLASPASIPSYTRLALETLMVGSVGTKNLLDLAKRDSARFFHTSTSEVYGEPQVHPQPETYWGNVNSYGGRAMYDEAKRFAEALIWVYRHQHGVNTGIVRIFNTYGPHMDPVDGRVVSNFIVQALKGEPITMYGEGNQTRSFCYVTDQIDGLVRMIESDQEGPVNIGNPTEFTMKELAQKVLALTKSTSAIVHKPLPPDDPTQRRPDIGKAKELLGWEPKVPLAEGLVPTIEYYKNELGSNG
ncbi:MAG TPA: UDP-glucuronic acid decarboxylase family protein [Candidatus Saccharimonadales bacterium]|nr:UDP-glucuronic acid decarboxylase family protein [Candidatus Saccharimonadales bacterium]